LPAACDPAAVRALCGDFQLPAFAASLILRKEFAGAGAIEAFLNPRLKRLSDPRLLPEMPLAVERIERALRNNERIVLYGDYDVDGVASLALLHRVIHAYGGRVECFLPVRADEGYGLSAAGIERCLEDHSPELLIAVDCGTNSTAEIAALRDRGIDVIVLDHHEPGPTRPGCAALVNPKCGAPEDAEFATLCSAGIAFKTAHAMMMSTPLPGFDLKWVLDLVALATLCDLVPLENENRIFVRHGLDQMTRSRWPGLAALMAVASVKAPVRATDVGFRLGPRINASGRLGAARESLDLLLTNDPLEATRIAASLDAQNRERQCVERAVTREAEDRVDASFIPGEHTSIVVGNRDWHNGVLGIVASRVMRRHYRPALIIGFDEHGNGKGSGRSIEGLSLVEALGRCAGLLGQFGGHQMAAGLNIREERFEEFRAAFESATRALLSDEMLIPSLTLDAEIDLESCGDELLDAQAMLEPFGMGNRQPVLLARGLRPAAPPRVLKEKHLSVDFPTANRRSWNAIFFNGSEHELPSPPWDVAFHLERNDWNGRTYPQMHILDIRAAA